MSESIFKRPTLIAYLVKSINDRYPDKQVGKTIIQKMMYILARKKLFDADYSMYYYGPYSQEVAGELNFAESTGIVEIRWVNDKGYFITPINDKLGHLEHVLRESEKKEIDDTVAKFGEFNANELSIIATALYLKDNFELDGRELIKAVHEIKDQHNMDYIKHILQRSGVTS